MSNTAAWAPHPFSNAHGRIVDIDTGKLHGVVAVDEQKRHNGKNLLRRKPFELWFRLSLCLGAALFIALPLLAWSLDKREVQQTQHGKAVLEAIKYGPTLFPIIFAAIVGNFLQAIALKYAQNGARLGTLEQLTRTVNIYTAITTPYFIRAYNRLSVILLFLWAVSPLGGQASLRLLSTKSVAFHSPSEVRFLSPTNISSYLSLGGENYGNWRVQADTLYTASLLGIGAAKHRAVDLWDNVRIPYIEELEKQTPQPGPDGWYNVTNKNTTYSSLLGIPVRGLTKNTVVTVQTSYSKLNCSFLGIVDTDACWYGLAGNRCFNPREPHLPEWIFPIANLKTYGINEYLSVGMNVSQVAERDYNPDPVDLVFQSTGFGGWTIANCKLSQTYVEVEITCISSQCAVSKLRRLHIGTPRPPLFYYATPGRSGTLANFVRDFALVSKSGKPTYSNTNQAYIYNPEDILSSLDSWVDLAEVGIENFEVRTTQLINTLMGAAQGPALFFSNFDIQDSPYLKRLGRAVAAGSSIGDSVDLKELFVCDKAWAALMLFAAVLVFSVGISSAIIAFTTLAPDTLGSLSVMAAESRYFDVPHEDSTLDRDEKAILLKDRIVKLGDVDASSGTGYIALGTVDTGNEGVTELATGRVYR
ncbi:hypothetical protein TWF281_000796 [Arthrobotrys megalospora]